MLGLLTTTYLIYLLGGPIQEEPGWRGFALPRLQERWDTARQDPGQLLAFLVLVVSMSFVMSWLANGSQGSVMLAILGHNGISWALFAAGALTGQPVASDWPAALGLAGLAVVTIAATRGRLGLPPRAREGQRVLDSC